MSSEGKQEKPDVSESHLCYFCKKTLAPFNYFSLRKYKESDVVDDDDILLESYDFCSTVCSTQFLKSFKFSDEFDFFEMIRCVGYYDCKRLDNLRRMCESMEKRNPNNTPLFLVGGMAPHCNPAEVGIIKSNIKLIDLIEKFDKTSTKISEDMLDHTKQMKWLTAVVLIISLLNLLMLFYQISWS
jgi:hypothetical protein